LGQGRSAYQPTIHHQGNRYIAYIGRANGRELAGFLYDRGLATFMRSYPCPVTSSSSSSGGAKTGEGLEGAVTPLCRVT